MSITTERILGGYLAPIAITVGALIFGQLAYGYLPTVVTPALLTITLVATTPYRRGAAAYPSHTARRSL